MSSSSIASELGGGHRLGHDGRACVARGPRSCRHLRNPRSLPRSSGEQLGFIGRALAPGIQISKTMSSPSTPSRPSNRCKRFGYPSARARDGDYGSKTAGSCGRYRSAPAASGRFASPTMMISQPLQTRILYAGTDTPLRGKAASRLTSRARLCGIVGVPRHRIGTAGPALSRSVALSGGHSVRHQEPWLQPLDAGVAPIATVHVRVMRPSGAG